LQGNTKGVPATALPLKIAEKIRLPMVLGKKFEKDFAQEVLLYFPVLSYWLPE